MLYNPTASYHRVMALTGDEAAASRAHARAEKARQRKALRTARVSREGDGRPTRDDMSPSHRTKMAVRRQHRRQIAPGFDPVPNERVSKAFNAAMISFVQMGFSPVDAHNNALRQVARMLPPGRMVRGAPKPSKNDNPAYRKGNR